jgi:hypothetical protein
VRGLLVLWGFASVIELYSVRLAPLPYSLVPLLPLLPEPLVPDSWRAYTKTVRWHRPLQGGASELHFTYPGVLDPGTPLCEP